MFATGFFAKNVGHTSESHVKIDVLKLLARSFSDSYQVKLLFKQSVWVLLSSLFVSKTSVFLCLLIFGHIFILKDQTRFLLQLNISR